MEIMASKLGKKFHPRWIFRNVDFTLGPHSPLVITGKNGSGKSTLLQIIAGYITPSAGQITWKKNSKSLPADQLFRHITMASPYIELIEDFTLSEMVRFHGKFKAYQEGLSHEKIIELSGLGSSRDKPVGQFSSGMKQRLKLLLALTSRSDLLLLDEPCSNLDADSVGWYHGMLTEHGSGRSIVIASNNKPEEYPGMGRFVELGGL